MLYRTDDSAVSGSSGDGGNIREWGLSFFRSPVEFTSDSSSGRVSGVRLEINKLEVCNIKLCVLFTIVLNYAW